MNRASRFTLAFVILGILVSASIAHEKRGKPIKKTDRHEMLYKIKKGEKKHKKGDFFDITVAALRGESAADVYVSVETDDPVKYPVPDEFEKLRIKILTANGNVVSVKTFRHVPITNGEAIVTLENLLSQMKVEVQGELEVRRKREEVVRGCATVLFRPDLIVMAVQAPAKAAPNALFDIAAVIQEVKLQSSASAGVSLYDGETMLATLSDVVVGAGGQSTVLFQGVSFADAGVHNLTIKISNAVPGEFDTGNNEYPFSVLIGNPVEPAMFFLSYSHDRNYQSSYTYINCGDGFTYAQEGDLGFWSYQAEIPAVLEGPIDSIRWESLSGTGSLSHSFTEGWTTSDTNSFADTYSTIVTDLDGSNYSMNLYVYKTLGYSYLDLKKMAGDYFYVFNFTDESSVYYEQNSSQMNLQDFLEVRLLVSDDGQQWGGSGSIAISAYEPSYTSWDYSFSDGGCDYLNFGSTSYEHSENSGSGTTNTAFLPTGRKKDLSPELISDLVPQSTDLMQNYPNPFNPTTNIQFTIEQSGAAVLKVYDMLGKEVAELFQGEAVEGTTYHFTFNAVNLASGMYYAKLEAGGKQYVKKMLLMK